MKIALYKNAAVTLFTIRNFEAFGLVMTESMQAGTPVVGIKRIGQKEFGAVG